MQMLYLTNPAMQLFQIELSQLNTMLIYLAITATIRGTSKEKLYEELVFEIMKEKRWFEGLSCFYKILDNQAVAYLYSLLPSPNRHCNTRNYSKIRLIFFRTEIFSNSFLPQTIREWNKLNTSILQETLYSVFHKTPLDFIRPTENCSFGTNDVSGLKLLTCLCFGFSHPRETKLLKT